MAIVMPLLIHPVKASQAALLPQQTEATVQWHLSAAPASLWILRRVASKLLNELSRNCDPCRCLSPLVAAYIINGDLDVTAVSRSPSRSGSPPPTAYGGIGAVAAISSSSYPVYPEKARTHAFA